VRGGAARANAGSVAANARSVIAVAPVLRTRNVYGVELASVGVAAYVMIGGEITSPSAIPVAESAVLAAPPGVTDAPSVAVFAPIVDGANRPMIVQLAPGASATVQSFIAVKSAASVPVTAMTGTPEAWPPVF